MDIKSISAKLSNLDELKSAGSSSLKLKRQEKKSVTIGLALAFAITLVYWMAGGRNLLIFPTILCITIVVKTFLLRKGPRNKNSYFTRGSRTLPVHRNK